MSRLEIVLTTNLHSIFRLEFQEVMQNLISGCLHSGSKLTQKPSYSVPPWWWLSPVCSLQNTRGLLTMAVFPTADPNPSIETLTPLLLRLDHAFPPGLPDGRGVQVHWDWGWGYLLSSAPWKCHFLTVFLSSVSEKCLWQCGTDALLPMVIWARFRMPLLRYKSCAVHFTYWELSCFSLFPELCSCHHIRFQNIFITHFPLTTGLLARPACTWPSRIPLLLPILNVP